jgi:hypothetical protein
MGPLGMGGILVISLSPRGRALEVYMYGME